MRNERTGSDAARSFIARVRLRRAHRAVGAMGPIDSQLLLHKKLLGGYRNGC